ncbi:hypothetical protein NQ317_014138 [Molorchus minor]|uniref:Transposase n=1 Tax=Molorchus minor TaxID=1323400 RepID=A0ABQ9JEZ6_9CUCU|nr:hypothetical protein NQ317_014138 [Molorchus minor]
MGWVTLKAHLKELFSNKLEGDAVNRERKMSSASTGSMKTKWLKAFKSLKTPRPRWKIGRLPKSEIVNLFRDQNVSQATIYRAIRDCEEGIACINLPKTGRPHVLSQNRVNTLVESAQDRVGISSRKLGLRFGVSYKTVQRTLSRNNVRFRKRRKCPKYTQGQLERIPRCCRSLRRTHFVRNRVIIMDDENYFTLSHLEMKGNDGYYTSDVENCPNEVKFKAKAKFADKVLVWCAISEAGISTPYVGRVRGEAVDAEIIPKDVYQNCLILLIIIKNDIIFWPDLASCHYARRTREWLEHNNINYVPREDNPPNVPQARPIEEFWSLLCRKVYDNGWEAQNEQQLRARIFRKIREVDLNIVQRKMRQVLTKLRAIEDHGPLSLSKNQMYHAVSTIISMSYDPPDTLNLQYILRFGESPCTV